MKKKMMAVLMAAFTVTSMVGTVAVQAEEADNAAEDTADVEVATGTDDNTITICTTNDPGREAA